MIRRALIGLGVGVAAVALHPTTAAAAGELVWPADPIALTSADDAFTTSVEVTNPTDADVTIVAPASGANATDNSCNVTITAGTTVPSKRQSTLSITVTPIANTCDDPVDGTHKIVLAEADGATAQLPIKKGAETPQEAKATGILWPTDAVFLHRRDGKLTGSFTVVNPTEALIKVTAPTFSDGCLQVIPDTGATPVDVPSHGEAKVDVVGPKSCADLSSTTIVATASAKTDDGSKADVVKLTFQAEVDWGRFGWFLAGAVVVGLALSLLSAFLLSHVKFKEPLRIDSSSPTSWLTGIATIGSLLTTLVSTTGLPKGLFGSDALPQQTLIIGAAAIALLLIGVGGLITGIPLARTTVEGKEQTCPRAWQFAVGAGLSAAAAALEIWAVTTALSRLDLPILGGAITIAQLGALIAAAIYLLVSVRHYVKTYGKEPPTVDPKPSDELVAALVEELLPAGASDDVAQAAGVRANHIAAEIAKKVASGGARKRASSDSTRAGFTRFSI